VGAEGGLAAGERDVPLGMDVGIDAAGYDDLASGVDGACDVVGEGAWRGDGDDLVALDCDVPRADAVGGDHAVTLDDEIEHGSLRLMLLGARNAGASRHPLLIGRLPPDPA